MSSSKPREPRKTVIISDEEWGKIAEEWDENAPTRVEIPDPVDVGAIPVSDTDSEHTPPAARCRSNCGMSLGDEQDAVRRGAVVILAALRERMRRAGCTQDTIEQTVQALLKDAGLAG